MAFAEHYRMSAIGRLGSAGNGDRFSYSLNLAKPGFPATLPALSPNGDVWDDAAADVVAFHARSDSQIASSCVLEEVKFAHIGPDGKYLEDPYIVNVTDTPGGIAQGNPAPVYPQVAVAASLVTARRGPTGKGRFFIPMPYVGVAQDTFLMSTTITEAIRDSAATLVNGLNNQPGFDVLDLHVVVASTKGYNTKVTGVRVGRVVDTIRSRRKQLEEQYTSVQPVS